MQNIKAIIFDFDGVINNGVEVHYDFYRDLCKSHNIEPPFSSKEELRKAQTDFVVDNPKELYSIIERSSGANP